MIILGLGGNVGDRLSYLRQALHLIKNIPHLTIQQVSPVYISDALLPENAPSHWNAPFLNACLRCETTLSPYELLDYTKKIEKDMGRQPGKDWGPRVIDIDLLAFDDWVQYDARLHIPHEHLHVRPFALFPLSDVAPHWVYPLPGPLQGKTAMELTRFWPSRFSGLAPFHTRQIQQRIDTSQLVGIVNLTPDSFSDDGLFLNVTKALDRIQHLVLSGADIIDIGAEATGPNASPLDPVTEWERLEPLLSKLKPFLDHLVIPPKISIDTRYPETAQKALDFGVDWINDVNGLDDPRMQKVLSSHHCDIVVMHHLGIPVNLGQRLPLSCDPIDILLQWMEKKQHALMKEGIDSKRIIFDVGIGYGHHPEQSLRIIKDIEKFHHLGTRLMVGHSRKSFLQQFTDTPPSERDLETKIFSLFLTQKNIHYLRIHDVEGHARAFKIQSALTSL